MGYGKILYTKLEEISKAQHILNLNACIGYSQTEDKYLNHSSAAFHSKMGYTLVGEFHNCGYKFNRWYNMIWMEKNIGEHIDCPLPIIPFYRLNESVLTEIGIKA